jgi:hypothetical protein
MPPTPRLPPSGRSSMYASASASASASCICETAKGQTDRQVSPSHRQSHITSAQACEDGSVAEGCYQVFEKAVGYHNPCRKEHLLPRAYAGGMAGDDTEQPLSVARDDLSRCGGGGEHRSRMSFSWPTTACCVHQSPVSCPPTLRRTRQGCQGCQARRPGAQVQTKRIKRCERLTLGLKAESLNIASHHRTLRYPPQRSFLPHTPRNGM